MTAEAAAAESGVMAAIWAEHLPTMLGRIEALDRAAVALASDTLDEGLEREAQNAAHQLAGSVGTFGFDAATDHAREAEHILRDAAGATTEDAPRLARLVADLRGELSQTPFEATTVTPSTADPTGTRVLLIDDDHPLTARLAQEAAHRGITTEIATSPDEGRACFQRQRPDAVVLDLNFGDGTDAAMQLLSELTSYHPPVPVLILTVREHLTDRIEVARRGAAGFLEKTLSPSDALDQVAQVLRSDETAGTRVLVVDDDPAVLVVIRAVLERRGLEVATLEDPLLLWDELKRVSPEILLLDVDMPGASGIELCRVIRNDSRWATVPVVVVTARRDDATIREIFAAGADDYLVKPVIERELVARVESRLKRSRLQRALAATDGLTGLANRRTSTVALSQMLSLANRHSRSMCLAEIDLDHFKRVNDRHGHPAGDAVLRRLGDILRRIFRGEDVVARWGGEEFVVGMYGVGREHAMERIDELLAAFRAELFDADGERFSLTFSAGVAEHPADGHDLATLYAAADGALYRAKAAGRNRVASAADAESTPQRRVDVAIVEDDDATAAVICAALDRCGSRWQRFNDGGAAASALVGENPKLSAGVVLLDVELPTLDGFEVLDALVTGGVLQSTRVLMLTARSGEDDVLRALERGAFDHVSKPFSVPVLMQKVSRALDH